MLHSTRPRPWWHCTIRLLCRVSANGEQARQVAARIMDAMAAIEASMIDHAASLPRSTGKAQRLLPDAHAAIANRSVRRRGQELSGVPALNDRLGRSEGIGIVSGRSQPFVRIAKHGVNSMLRRCIVLRCVGSVLMAAHERNPRGAALKEYFTNTVWTQVCRNLLTALSAQPIRAVG